MNVSAQNDPKKLASLAAALCFLLPLLVFLSALGGGFLIWDDDFNLLENSALWQPLGDACRWMFTSIESVQRYKPVNWIVWRALGSTFGLNPIVFHALNLFLHALNCWLLFRVIHAFLLGRKPTADARPNAALFAAFAAALWWGLHPLRVEPVAWISGAGYPLSTLFALLSVRSFQSCLPDACPRFQWGAIGWFALALLSYPAAASLPALLLALALLVPASEKNPAPRDVRRLGKLLAPYAVMALVLLAMTWLTRLETSGRTWHRPASWEEVGAGTRLIHGFAVWAWYLEKTLLPLDLSPIYAEFWRFSPLGSRAIAGVSSIVLVSIGATLLRRRFPEAPVLWGAFLLLAVPVLGITDLPFSPADRYNYVPGLALALLLAVLAQRGATLARPWARAAAITAGSLVLTVYPAVTLRYLNVWLSPVRFFENAIARVGVHPLAADLHWRLGMHFLTMNKAADAEREFGETLRLNPGHAEAAHYLRSLRRRQMPTMDRPGQPGLLP